MSERESKLADLVKAVLAAEERGREAPEFQHLWTRAQADIAGGQRAHGSGASRVSSFWTTATAAAVLLAVGIGIHGLRESRSADAATAALMSELAANVQWHSPSDRLLAFADHGLINELPNIPMVDTSPEEWDL